MDPFSLIYAKEEGIAIEPMSPDPFLSDSSFEFLPSECLLRHHLQYTNRFSIVHDVVVSDALRQFAAEQRSEVHGKNARLYSPTGHARPPYVCKVPMECSYHLYLSLSFINPPEPTYHVRYLSEITNAPLDGNMVNTKKKTKKNVSGRYLKGIHGRHVTIAVSHAKSILVTDCQTLGTSFPVATYVARVVEFTHTCHAFDGAAPRCFLHSSISSSLLASEEKSSLRCDYRRLINLLQIEQGRNLFSF